MSLLSLFCDECGCEAISSPTGEFQDGEGEQCETCGHPGHVSVQEDVDGNGTNEAAWVSEDPS